MKADSSAFRFAKSELGIEVLFSKLINEGAFPDTKLLEHEGEMSFPSK